MQRHDNTSSPPIQQLNIEKSRNAFIQILSNECMLQHPAVISAMPQADAQIMCVDVFLHKSLGFCPLGFCPLEFYLQGFVIDLYIDMEMQSFPHRKYGKMDIKQKNKPQSSRLCKQVVYLCWTTILLEATYHNAYQKVSVRCQNEILLLCSTYITYLWLVLEDRISVW